MSTALRQRLFDELDSITLIDPHTHINAHAPASTTLADILGYHYYTELAHSAGMPKARIEEANLDPKEKVGRLVEYLSTIENTVQSSWLLEMCQVFFGFEDEAITKAQYHMENPWHRMPLRVRMALFAVVMAVALAGVVAIWRYGSLSAASFALRGYPLAATPVTLSIAEVAADEETPLTFHLRNLTSKPVTIVGSRVSCTCSRLENLPITIAPRATAEVVATLTASEASVGRQGDCTISHVPSRTFSR